jgi:hypothetical protein
VKKINAQFISVPFKAASGSGVTEYNGIAIFARRNVF